MKVNVTKGFRPNATDSKSVELRFMSVRVGLGVPLSEKMNQKKYVTCVTFFNKVTYSMNLLLLPRLHHEHNVLKFEAISSPPFDLGRI